MLLGVWALSVFAVSAVTDPRVVAGAGCVAVALLWRGALQAARKTVVAVVPLTLGLTLMSWAGFWLSRGSAPDSGPYVALGLRTLLIAFLTFSMLARVALLRALAPFPALTRLLVMTLGQIHALRMIATDSLLGLRSRMIRKPTAIDVVRGAGAVTASLLTLSLRNARDVADAMRSRGF